MKHQNNFKKKYGIDAIDFVEKADLEYFGIAKTNGIQSVLKTYAEKNEINIEFNDDFYKDLVEAFAEAGKRFPYNDKIRFDSDIYQLEPSPVNPSIPKSKGVLEDFKDIVSDDVFRPNMSAVYVSENGFLYGTDAHKLIKYKNKDYSEYAGKLINLKLFIDSKGKKLDFVDERPLQFELVIPKNNPEVVENLPTYNFYNFSKSVVALKKLLSDDIFNIIFDFKGESFGFNPILMTDVFHFALCKGFDTFTLEYSTPNRAIVFKFKDDSLGLIMPIMVVEDSLRGTTKITIEKIISDYGYSKQMPKTKVTKTVKYPVETEKEVPYKKYEGGIDKTTYIPRRDISYVALRNGEKLSANDIIDGVYRVNKMAKGGGVGLKANDIALGTWLQHKTTKTKAKVWNVEPITNRMQLQDVYGNKDTKWRYASEWKITTKPKEDKYETGGNIKLSPDEKKMIRNSYWANNDVDVAMKYVSEKIPPSKYQPAKEYMQTLYKKGGKVTPAKQKKVAKVMKEWKKGELHIGTSDKIVKDQKQAVAIALSEAGLSKPTRGWKHKRKK